MSRTLRLLGHRGVAAELPENTLPSFERAVQVGVDALELDVHLTRDGQVVVAHDATGARMADREAAIAQSSFNEVRRWDVGWGFVNGGGERPHAGRGFVVPSLGEVLDAFPSLHLNIDLKAPGAALATAVLRLLRERGASSRVTLASFHAATMRALRKQGFAGEMVLARDEVVGLLACPRGLWRKLGGAGSAAQVPLRIGPIDFASRGFIAKCHAVGLRVDYWTVDDPLVAEVLLDRGADGIISNDPARLRPLFDRYRTAG